MMKKRIISVLILALLPALSLFAAQGVRFAPYPGAFNVPLYSEDYIAGESATWQASGPSATYYTDNQMIALMGIYEVPSTQIASGTLKVTVSCPDGFFFVSQSNPTFKRPFEILLKFKEGNASAGGTNATDQHGVILTSETQTEEISFSDFTGKPTASASANRLWCDVVLRLPYDTDGIDRNNDVITVGGQNYPMTTATDYTALVTVVLEYTAYDTSTGLNVTYSDTYTVPFTGYYERRNAESSITDSYANMYVSPNANASRINIEESMGHPVNVGTLYMWMSTAWPTNQSSTKPDFGQPRIFVSSSRDPNSSSAKTFTLNHSSVTAHTALTSTNSIGYTVRLTTTSNDYSNLESEANAVREFEGDDYIQKYLQDQDNAGWVTLTELNLESENPAGGSIEDYSYYQYEADIDVIIDSRSTLMFSGLYTSNIYIHLVEGH